jgi:acyl-CoA dehydrogenase
VLTALETSPTNVVLSVDRIAASIADASAHDVDRLARFPTETFEALRADGVLGALVPTELGGGGASIADMCEAIRVLGGHCASSAMVLAMHQLQVVCLDRHGRTDALRRVLADVAARQLLIASATSEVGTGGSLRRSECALEGPVDRLHLRKEATVLSYGGTADVILATTRRSPESEPGDQVLACCLPPSLSREQIGEWDALGMRGTCSARFVIEADVEQGHIFADPFSQIATATMVPLSHVLWCHVWLGIATDAVARARNVVRGEARAHPGQTPDRAHALAELAVMYQQMEALAHEGLRRFESPGSEGLEPSLSTSLWFNSLKVAQSRSVVDVVGKALTICGMAGYRDTGSVALGRHLRDAFSAPIMVGNDRILADNAQLARIGRIEP